MHKNLLCVIAALLPACTTSLSTTSDRRAAVATSATKGIEYSLPMLQYEVKIARNLAQCWEPDAAGKPTTTAAVVMSVAVEAAPKYVAGETYLVDYTSLASLSKITSFELETHEATGTLKAINASAEDRSAEIIVNTAKLAIGVASLAAGIPPIGAVAPAAGPGGPQMLACKPDTQALLDAVQAAGLTLKNATSSLETITGKIATMTEQARANALSDADKAKLLQLIEDQKVAQKAVAAAQQKANKASNAVSSTISLRWPRSFNGSDEVAKIDGEGLVKLAALLHRVPLVPGDNGRENPCDATVAECVEAKTAVELRLDALVAPVPATTVRTDSDELVKAEGPAKGIFVRPPVRGRLIACQHRPTPAQCTESSALLLLRTDDGVVPQLGQLRFLPFQNEMFQNNALALSLRTDGSVEKFSYKNLKAQGEVSSAASVQVVDQLRGYTDALRTHREAQDAAAAADVLAERSETLAALQFQIDEQTRRNDYARLMQTPLVSDLAPIQAQTEQANARAALLRALKAELDAQAALYGS